MPGFSQSRSLAKRQQRRLSNPAILPVNQPTLAMGQTLEKVALVEKLPDSRTAHLQPIIDFLKAQGNDPASGDEFTYNRDGFGEYLFHQSLDVEALRQRFTFPPTILLTKDAVQDTRNFVAITQALPPSAPLTFNL